LYLDVNEYCDVELLRGIYDKYKKINSMAIKKLQDDSMVRGRRRYQYHDIIGRYVVGDFVLKLNIGGLNNDSCLIFSGRLVVWSSFFFVIIL